MKRLSYESGARPRIRFKLNKNLDKKTAFDFLNLRYAGVDFGQGIISQHPVLKQIKKEGSKIAQKRIISKYVDQFYYLHKTELEDTAEYLRTEWRKIEPVFFREVDKIFHRHPWPKGKYICYISIFNCNPRFLYNKTWQVFYKNKKEMKRIVAHELLHFIFYDYLNRKFKKKMSANKKWGISEIFNTIILNGKDLRRVISPSRELGYPEHQKYLAPLTRQWRKCINVLVWFGKATEIVP